MLSHTDSDNRTTTYTYNPDGELLTVTKPDGTVYINDTVMENITEQYPGDITNTITYNDDGTVKDSNLIFDTDLQYGIQTHYEYDGYGRVSQYSTTSGSNTRNYTYTYDASGNIETISLNQVLKVKYYYDLSNQLIREDNAWLNQTITYDYDTNGNLLTKAVYAFTTGDNLGTPIYTNTNQYNSEDQLMSYYGYPITYDADGNMQMFKGWTLTWDNGKLQGLIGNADISYHYNSDEIRESKTVNGVTTTYTLDSDNNITGESNGTDVLNYYYASDGRLVYFTLNGTPYYYEKNLQGDIIGIVDGSNTEVVTYTYDSWGVLIGVGGPMAGTVGVKNPFRYRGYYYDTETGMYYLQSRYYNPEIARFISEDDPSYCVGEVGPAANLYAYCCNNPVMLSDYDGHWVQFIAIGAIAVGALLLSSCGNNSTTTKSTTTTTKTTNKTTTVTTTVKTTTTSGKNTSTKSSKMPSITYCPQFSYIKGYNKNDWGNYNSGDGCAVACTVMAFSSLGISVKPKDICGWNGKKVVMDWAAVAKKKNIKVENRNSKNGPYQFNEIQKRIDNYQNNPKKYAPPIILLPTDINPCHYIILIGYTSKNIYYFIDPGEDINRTKNTTWKISKARQIVQFYK